MNKELKNALEHFETIKSELHDLRDECDHPSHSFAQEELFRALTNLSIEDIKSNIEEMSDDELEEVAWSIDRLLPIFPELIPFFAELGEKRNHEAIKYEVKPFLEEN